MGHERARFPWRTAQRPAERAAHRPRRRPEVHRPGFYDDPSTHEGYPDNAERFLFFTRAAIEAVKGFGEPFDVLHAHDQQAAWAPCFVRTHDAEESAFAGTATVFTIHNLGYQGIVDPWASGSPGFRTAFFPAVRSSTVA
jgi:glycogen synthase